MTALATPLPLEVDHRWELRLEEFEDGQSFRRFECVDCGAVRFEGASPVRRRSPGTAGPVQGSPADRRGSAAPAVRLTDVATVDQLNVLVSGDPDGQPI